MNIENSQNLLSVIIQSVSNIGIKLEKDTKRTRSQNVWVEQGTKKNSHWLFTKDVKSIFPYYKLKTEKKTRFMQRK